MTLEDGFDRITGLRFLDTATQKQFLTITPEYETSSVTTGFDWPHTDPSETRRCAVTHRRVERGLARPVMNGQDGGRSNPDRRSPFLATLMQAKPSPGGEVGIRPPFRQRHSDIRRLAPGCCRT
ncbi:hypothetical protein [Aliidongia dinghuensis]|uniref:hypothetical protein n=1 Tax=Aliidongia dinghuensis TaxID=1867774 RepID=UPI0016675896|nr:hypothetical protein [Aliidongia dinghuensis]